MAWMDAPIDATLAPVLERIEARAAQHDIAGEWPTDDISDLRQIGAMGWAIPRKYGGTDVAGMELHNRYEQIASASLATAMVISQRDAGVGYIEACSNESLKAKLLPKLARNQLWTTIGISHLTTSNRSGALAARRTPKGNFVLNGAIPWATGGEHAEFIVAGARTDDDLQMLFVLPTRRKGVTVHPPQQLAALSAAPTHSVTCENVLISSSLVISGPSDKALCGRARSVQLGQTFAAFGLTRAALKLIEHFDSPAARSTHEALSLQLTELRRTVHEANTRPDDHDLQSGPLLRSECNNLAIRASHAAVTLYKGAALRLDHPAQRIAREGLFLLVWSSPSSVVDRNLELMSDPH